MSSEAVDRELVEAYLQYGRMRVEEAFGADELSWAYDAVSEIVDSSNPEDSLPLVLALITEAPDEVVNYVAAGPLEDSRFAWSGSRRSHIENAAVNPKMRIA